MFVNVAYQTRNKIKLDATWNWVGSKRVPIAYQSAAYLSPAFAQVAFQISKEYQKKYEWYLGVENALNYMQTSAIILPQSPFDPGFDAAMIWGPLMGRSVYAGVRLQIK